MPKNLNTYEQWQMDTYGNILPVYDSPEEFENGEIITHEQGVWFEREQEVWLEEQHKSL
jgi:hypothetical protein